MIEEILAKHGYIYKEFLGSGTFSNVGLCESQKYHQQFAVKRAIKHKITEDEYKALVSLIHPNIIRLYDAFEEDDWQYLIMEYCQNGSISKKGVLSYDIFIHYAKQLLEALQYCHSMQIAHRDIKPDNIFIDQYNQIKLGDFGLSKQFDDKRKSSDKCGSLMFFAPEMFQYSEYCPFKTDIWALGITFYIIATGKRPYKTSSIEELKKCIIYGELDFSNCNIDQQIRFLISKMTSKNPKARPSIEKLLKLPMFSPTFAKKQSLLLFNPKKPSYTTGYSIPPNSCNNTSSNLYQIQNISSDDEKRQNDILTYRKIVAYPNMQRIGIRNMAKPI